MTTYRIALNFEDGVTRFIDCGADEKVTDAAFRNRINIPMDCRDGVCGACKCRAEKGAYDLGDYLDDAMTQEEAAEGFVLTCQMTPRSDCVVAVPTTSAACKTGAQTWQATVAGVDLLSDTATRLRLTVEQPIGFLPGQYVNIAVPGADQTRAYSFASHPDAVECAFLIRNVPGGLMSGWLTGRARPGDPLRFTGAFGAFYLRPVERPVLMLAGGTGLAPLLSMLETLAATGCDQPILLVYAVTREADLVEVDRIETLRAKLPSLSYMSVVADPNADHPRKGYATHHLSPQDAAGADVYLCGPPPMVEAVRAWFRDSGARPASFHFEKFNPAGVIEAAA
ncbi:MAG: benzoate 1,2-dioxygenase electron transfer component BenC [Rubrimonas sp.]